MTAIEFALGLRRECRRQGRLTDLQLDVLLAMAAGMRTVKEVACYYGVHGNGVSRAFNDLVDERLIYVCATMPWRVFALEPEGRRVLEGLFSFQLDNNETDN